MTSDNMYRDFGGQPVLFLGNDERDPTRVVLRLMRDELVMPRTEWERLPLWSGLAPIAATGHDHA
jgi:hypothetical protein